MDASRPQPGHVRSIEGNAPIRLDGAHALVVRSGALALFLARNRESVADARRHLFGVEAGDTVLWQAMSGGAEVVAVAIEPTEIIELPMADVIAAIDRGDGEALVTCRRWTSHLDPAFTPPGHDTSAGPDGGSVIDRLRVLQQDYLAVIDRVDEAERLSGLQRFRQRQRLDEQVTVEALAGLTAAAVVPSVADGHSRPDTSIVDVLRQVGAASGFEVRTPRDPAAGVPTLQRVLDSSGARGRPVQLAGSWWRRQGEVFIGSVTGTGEPVGLVPRRLAWFRGTAYRAYVTGRAPRDVDADLAGALAPTAVAITPPLGRQTASRDVLRWALRGQGPDFVSALLCGVAAVVVGMVAPQATKMLFETTIPEGDRRGLVELGACLLAAALGGVLFDVSRSLSLLRLTTGAATRLQLSVWDRLLGQAPAFFRPYAAGDLENRVGAVTQIHAALGATALAALIGAAASLLNIGLMLAYSRTLTVAALVVTAIGAAVSVSSGVLIRSLVGPMKDCDGQLRGLLTQLVAAVPKIRVAGAEARAFARWAELYAVRTRLAQRVRLVGDRVRLANAALPPLATAALFWMAAPAPPPAPPSLTVGAFVAFSTAFGTFLAGVTTLGASGELLLGVSALWARLRPILDAAPERQEQRNSPGRLSGRVRMDHVTFRYRADGRLTLDDVSIDVAPGECVALVGPSGSGKSTIVNLLLRFEVPASGAVYLDDHDLQGLDIQAVRQQVGVVGQDNTVLAGSLFDNIACGIEATHEDAWAAAAAAGFDGEIRQMPMGLHTVVSEGGTNLSGGQRQRLLIARAMLRKPALLILDEATSALDNHSQAIVTNSLNLLKVTRIVVAHRLSTIRDAHRIYVIEAGRVVQSGTFEALMREDGLFSRLMKRQVA